MKTAHKRRVRLFVVAIAVAAAAGCSSDPTMPDTSGMREAEAEQVLLENGIEDWTVEWHEGPNPSVVVDQQPDPGEPVHDDTEVRIVLSGE